MRILLGLAGICVAGFCCSLGGQEPSKIELAQRAKAGVALVEMPGEHSCGSAFCIHESGLFITNEHVVHRGFGANLILHPGLKNQKVIRAKVVRIDKELDLALLKCEEDAVFTPLPLGSADGLAELTEVIAIGFPFGKELTFEKGTYPAVSVNAGRVTSRRLKHGELHRLQMDAVVNPGNSGGPILDAKGKVVGVVESGVLGANVNFAIPVEHVRLFIGTPEVEILAPSIAYAERHQAAAFQARLVTIVPGGRDFDVEMILGSKETGERSVKMKLESETYRATVKAVDPDQGVSVTISYRNGSVQGWVADRCIKVGKDEVKLSDIRRLQFGAHPTATLANDKVVKGALSGLDELAVAFGEETWKTVPAKALYMVVRPAAKDTSVACTVVVRRGDKELTRVQQVVGFRDVPNDFTQESRVLDGLWVLERQKRNGGTAWPIHPDEAVLIQGTKIRWVKQNGKVPFNCPEATFTVDPTKSPKTMNLTIKGGIAANWQAIYKIDGDRLFIATNCDEDTRPVQFTTDLTAGPERAAHVRIYRRPFKD